MPGSVALAVVTDVLPLSLSTAFVRDQNYAVQINEYADGRTHRKALVANSRKAWRQSKRLTPDQMKALRDFYDSHGNTKPFWYYDPGDTSPKFTSDSTGVRTVGRYTVRFEGAWQQSYGIARGETGIVLLEVA